MARPALAFFEESCRRGRYSETMKINHEETKRLTLCCLNPVIAGYSAGRIELQAKPTASLARVKLNFTAEAEKFNAARSSPIAQ
jgi:hypothetical protein